MTETEWKPGDTGWRWGKRGPESFVIDEVTSVGMGRPIVMHGGWATYAKDVFLTRQEVVESRIRYLENRISMIADAIRRREYADAIDLCIIGDRTDENDSTEEV